MMRTSSFSCKRCGATSEAVGDPTAPPDWEQQYQKEAQADHEKNWCQSEDRERSLREAHARGHVVVCLTNGQYQRYEL